MTKMIPFNEAIYVQDIDGMTANEFLAWAHEIVEKVPEPYRDHARIVDEGYEGLSYYFQWQRPQTDAERQKEERDQREREARDAAARYAREKAEYERLKAKFG